MTNARQRRLVQPPTPTPPPQAPIRPTVDVPAILMEELVNALSESQRASTALRVFVEARGLQGYYRLVFPGAQLVPAEPPNTVS